MQELADAVGVTRATTIAFNPDDLGIRDKLRLASTRDATVAEDITYSLIGIFESDIRPEYGEGCTALGHLLEEMVACSGEVTVLDWTGQSSPYNSPFPASLAVYSRFPDALHTVDAAAMESHVAAQGTRYPGTTPCSSTAGSPVYSQSSSPAADSTSRAPYLQSNSSVYKTS